MALMREGKHFCRWHHVENGRDLQRRLHVIEIQANDGRIYTISGKDLPNSIMTCTGEKYQGKHMMQILMNPGNHCIVRKTLSPAGTPPVICVRDFFAAIIGIGFFIGTIFVLSLMERCAALF